MILCAIFNRNDRMAHPFFLRLPYVAKLDNSIEPGQSLVIRGQAIGDKVIVNFCNGVPIDGCELVFHLSCRQKENAFVLNNFDGKQWGKEVRAKGCLDKASPFCIRIRCHDNKFAVYANGKEVGEFAYRGALAAISHVQVLGELTLNAVGWEGNYYGVPYKVPIVGNFGRQRKLFLTFIPDDERVDINLMAGEDIAFHFNPRFYSKETINNSQFGGQWGKEEKVAKFPFQRKKAVDVLFVCENDQIGVYVDSEPYCTFIHRIDPQKIDKLAISGGMELQVVNFE